MSYPVANTTGQSYYYCYDCSYYIPAGYYCAHTYYGISSDNARNYYHNYNNSHNNNNNNHTHTGRDVVVDSTRRINHGATHTTRYTVRVYTH